MPSKRNDLLQDNSELRAIALQFDRGEIDPIHADHAVLGTWKAAIRPMMVDLPDPEGPTSAVTVPGLRPETHVVQHRLARLVCETDVLENNLAANLARSTVRARVLVFGTLAQYLVRAVESASASVI